MNDQLSGQLGWNVPAYARDLLWLESDSRAVAVEGAAGLFTLDAPAEVLTVRWGGAQGSALQQVRWQVDSLEWDGAVAIGGYVDSMHITEIDGLPAPIVVLSIGGQPLKPGITPYPNRAARRAIPYPVPDFYAAIADNIEESVTTWIAFDDSPALTLAQDALVSKLRVCCFGHLADQKAGWHEHLALPIALEGMTLFTP